MKKLLLLFAVLLGTVGAWAQATAKIEVSTNVSNPEKVYTLKMLNGYWMTSRISPTKTYPAKFAFFADDEKENAYKVYCIDAKKWLSYDEAESYSNGTGKGKLVETQADANSWGFAETSNGGVSCYEISPLKSDGTTASIYWNWIYGVGQHNPEDGDVTIGYYTGNGATDKGSAWVLTELTDVPTIGTEYMLLDKCGTYLDLLHYGVEANSANHTQLATMNSEPQPLYITTTEDNWTWKIHTEAEGGKYLHQSSSRSWNSWVSEDGNNFVWKVELVVVDNEILYTLKHESGNQNGYLGGDSHSAGKELYVNNSNANQKLKLKFAEAKVVYNFKLADEIIYTQTFYTKKGVEYPDYTIEIPEGISVAAKPNGTVTKLYEVVDIKLSYSNLPFEVTAIKDGVFAEDTKWYYLTMRNKGVTYDPATGKALANNPSTKDAKNMFAFVGNPVDGFSIYNYVAGVDKIFWREDDTNGGRIFFTKISETDANTWELHANGDKGYVFKIKGTANGWMNDHKNDLAIWNYGLGATDEGSTITFTEVPAEELLANVKAYLPNVVTKANSINGAKGEWIGYYSVPVTFDGAYASAQAITESSALHEIVSATHKLQTAVESSMQKLPDPNKFYAIKSASKNAYCAGQYVYAIPTSSVRHASDYADRTYDHRHLIFEELDDFTPAMLWQFTADMKMKNVHTGEYVKSFNKDVEHMGAAADAAIITIGTLGEGQVYLKIGNNSPMHAQEAFRVIVNWVAEKDNASAWIFEEVEEFSHTTTITEAGWSTIVLGFNAEIPDGVEAYAVSSTDNDCATLTPITGVLAAGEAVVLKNTGTYQFAYTTTTPTEIENNLLDGTLFDRNVSQNAYVLSKSTSGIGFYKAALNQAEGTAFKNNANKAYLPIEGTSEANVLRILFDGTETAIEGIEAENTADAVVYDLAGRRVQKAQKGLYIVNGKKVIK